MSFDVETMPPKAVEADIEGLIRHSCRYSIAIIPIESSVIRPEEARGTARANT